MNRDVCESLVMVVEDDRDVRDAILEVLEDHAYEPVAAANGKEALDFLRGAPAKPCLILLDVMMPVMDGRQFRSVQQQDPELSSIPVVVLSAQVDAYQAAAELGSVAHLRKPVQLKALLSTVGRYCRGA